MANTLSTHYARKVTFANGYGASIICRADLGDFPVEGGEALGELIKGVFGPGSYGAEDGLFEVAVLGLDGNVTYDTEITDDVIGYLDFADVAAVMARIALL